MNDFLDERKDTDKNLDAERKKTDRSLSEAKKRTENATDVVLRTERSEADERTIAARNESDDLANKARLAGETDHRTAAEVISGERLRADAAIGVERARIDRAIVQERGIKSTTESALLERERTQTDKSLLSERIRTDSVVKTAGNRLLDEQAEHEETRHALATRDEFLAIANHDLRNPIGVIFSCMEMLLDEASERNIDDQTQQWLELAKRNAGTALRLIHDLLDTDRISRGALELEFKPWDLSKIVRESIDSSVHVASSKSILLRAIPPGFSCELTCDRDRILQILSNLIGNALKFTPQQGKVIVETKFDANEVTISVCDTGPGIPSERISQIFEKFAQLRSKDRSGLGLGLHISKTLVELHGGTLSVESTVGRGSTFTIRLPRHHDSPTSGPSLPDVR